jgi:hypothetical protein
VATDRNYCRDPETRPGKLPPIDYRDERNIGDADVLYFEAHEGHKHHAQVLLPARVGG